MPVMGLRCEGRYMQSYLKHLGGRSAPYMHDRSRLAKNQAAKYTSPKKKLSANS